MSTALAIWTPPALVSTRRPLVLVEPPMPLISAFMGRRERLHFAFLHTVKRIWIEDGHTPSDCERTVIQHERGHVHWWRIACRRILEREVEMQLAEDDDLMAVVVPLSRRVPLESELYPWYPDGWQELVRWAQAGCPMDASDLGAAKLRVAGAAADRDRLAALPAIGDEDNFGRDDLTSRADAGPLFEQDLPPLSNDLEAELYGDEPEPWEGY